MRSTSQQSDQLESMRRLRAVTRRIEAFFGSQVQKLSDAMRQLENMQAEYEAAKRLAVDLDQQRSAWREERDCEVRRLEAANEALAKSWTDLEQQRRDFEISRLQAESTKTAPARATGAATGSAPAPKTPVATEKPSATPGNAEPAKPAADNSVMERFVMQQLQNQVREHQRRKR